MSAVLAAVLVAAVVTTGLAVGLLWSWVVAVGPALRARADLRVITDNNMASEYKRTAWRDERRARGPDPPF